LGKRSRPVCYVGLLHVVDVLAVETSLLLQDGRHKTGRCYLGWLAWLAFVEPPTSSVEVRLNILNQLRGSGDFIAISWASGFSRAGFALHRTGAYSRSWAGGFLCSGPASNENLEVRWRSTIE
jgi:hypothetical protein